MRPVARLARRDSTESGQLPKWLIFSVLIPLLPIGAHIAAGYFSDRSSDVTFIKLFGDGELLVLATVISAAAIGDLVFDTLKRATSAPQLSRIAITVAANLVIVVIAVLFFGLVTLDNESRAAALETQRDQAAQLEAQAQDLERQAANLEAQAKQLQVQAVEEMNGSGPSGEPGPGALASFLQAQAEQLQVQAEEVAREATFARHRANEQLSAASESVSTGRVQTAIVSVSLFISALVGGCAALIVAGSKAMGAPKRDDGSSSSDG